MEKNMILFGFLIFAMMGSHSNIFAQKFPISPNGVYNYSVNYLMNEIHFDDYSGKIKTYNIQTKEITNSIFPSLPQFFHQTNKAVYPIYNIEKDSIDIYLFDYSDSSTIYLTRERRNEGIAISQNDKNVILPSWDGAGSLRYFSFSDSSLHTVNQSVYIKGIGKLETKDSFVYFISVKYDSISDEFYDCVVRYDFETAEMDTIFQLNEIHVTISDLSLNPDKNLLTLSIWYPDGIGIGFWLNNVFNFDIDTKQLTPILFANENQIGDLLWIEYNVNFNNINWSTDGKFLSMIGSPSFGATISYQVIYLDSLEKTTLVYMGNGIPDDYGIFHYVKWLGSSTISYLNLGVGGRVLYGYNLLETIKIMLPIAEENIPKQKQIEVFSNYPNPFNPSTTFLIKLDRPAVVKINIYNSLGQLVKVLAGNFIDTGGKTIRWDGKNDNGLTCGSGLYIAVVESENKILSQIKMSLVK